MHQHQSGRFVLGRNTAGPSNRAGKPFRPGTPEKRVSGVVYRVGHGIGTLTRTLVYLLYLGVDYLRAPAQLGEIHVKLHHRAPVLETPASSDSFFLVPNRSSADLVTPHNLLEGLGGVVDRVDHQGGLPAPGDAEDGGSTPVFVEIPRAEGGGDGTADYKVVEMSVLAQVVQGSSYRAYFYLYPLSRV